MRKLLLGSAGALAVLVAMALSLGTASAGPLYAGCSPGDTSSPCYWAASSSNYKSNIVIMQGGGDTNFDVVNLSSNSAQYSGCYFYGPGYEYNTCDPFKWVSPNNRTPLVTNILAGTPLQGWLGSSGSTPTNLWFPG
jgi:hypothetical protein